MFVGVSEPTCPSGHVRLLSSTGTCRSDTWHVSQVTKMYQMFNSVSSFKLTKMGCLPASPIPEMSHCFGLDIHLVRDFRCFDFINHEHRNCSHQIFLRYVDSFLGIYKRLDLKYPTVICLTNMCEMFVSVQLFNYGMSEWDVTQVHMYVYMYVTDGFVDAERLPMIGICIDLMAWSNQQWAKQFRTQGSRWSHTCMHTRFLTYVYPFKYSI